MQRTLRLYLLCVVFYVLGQLAAFADDPIWFIRASELTKLNKHTYRVPYQLHHARLWDINLDPYQDVTFTYQFPRREVNPLDVGGYFNPCFLACLGDFGAEAKAGISTQAGLEIYGFLNIGSVDVDYPTNVTIELPPIETIHGGQEFTIRTSAKPRRGARFNVNTPAVGYKVYGLFDTQLYAGVKAKAFGDTILDFDLLRTLKIPNHFNVRAEMLDSGNLLKRPQDFTIWPGELYGWYQVPNLDASAELGANSNSPILQSYKRDTILNVTADITNFIFLHLLFLPPFNGSVNVLGFGVTFQLLDLRAIADLSVEQDCTLEVSPTITLKGSDGKTYSAQAGQDIKIKMPQSGSLRLTPTFQSQGRFKNRTGLVLTPSMTFTPLHLAGHGKVFDFELFSFDWNPFGTLSLSTDLLSANLVDSAFDMPTGEKTSGHFFVVDADTSAPRLESVTPNIVFTGYDNLSITAKITGGYTASSRIVINDTETLSTTIDSQGVARATIPCRFRTDPGAINVKLYTAGRSEPYSNSLTIYVNPEPINRGLFSQLIIDQSDPAGGPMVAAKAPLNITGKISITSQFCPIQRLSPNSTLLFDGISISTSVTSSTSLTFQGNIPVYETQYEIKGRIPEDLQLRGGTHKIGIADAEFLNTDVDLETITLQNPTPVLKSQFRVSSTHSATGSIFEIGGTNFTPESILLCDGVPCPTQFISRRNLQIEVPKEVLRTPGEHFLTVFNPTPGGGASTPLMFTTPLPPTLPRLKAQHTLYRDAQGKIGHQVTLQNVGRGNLSRIQINDVRLICAFTLPDVAVPLPVILPFLSEGKYASLIVGYPATSACQPGQVAIARVSGSIGRRKFVLSNRVIIP